LNLQILQSYWPIFLEGAFVTLKISIISIFLSMTIGFLLEVIRYYRVPVLKTLVNFYIELSRNTPLLVQLFFIYFGLPKIGVVFSGEVSAVIGVVFLGSSYFAEGFRSGIEAIPKHQEEVGKSLGMNSMQVMRYILLPQALRIALPSIFANSIFLLKETSVVSAIAVKDLMYVAKDLMGNHYQTTEALTMLVIFYLLIILPIVIFALIIERKLNHD